MNRRVAMSLLIPAFASGRPGAVANGIEEDFSRGMKNWWVEGGERVWVEDGRLHMRADNPELPGGGVATAWCKTIHPGDFELTLNAQVISSSTGVNNINLFFCYSDPSGAPLYETRQGRAKARYSDYHRLSGNIITFLNGGDERERNPDGSLQARIRIRHNPGFRLLAEKFDKTCRQGVTYHLGVTKRGGRISFSLDGELLLTGVDPHPAGTGLLGLRTYRTYLWWDDVKLTPLT
ncbi:MAG: DUF1961 family protein [Bryobacterales bacterium]|nr:DUF1961 family protein [Bryobacterales bacterium]